MFHLLELHHVYVMLVNLDVMFDCPFILRLNILLNPLLYYIMIFEHLLYPALLVIYIIL